MGTLQKVVFLRDTNSDELSATRDLHVLFSKKLRAEIVHKRVQVVRVSDIGIYKQGWAVKIWPDNITYAGFSEEDISEIIEKSIKSDEKIERLMVKPLALQKRIVLRNCGVIDPESIEQYIGRNGYEGLKKALSLGPDGIIEEIKASGLRGRGGGGFPTWLKWNFAKKAQGEEKFIICNADEGDPGAYMDRSVLEGDPHAVIEGMIIAGHAIGANKGFFYVRAEYPLAIKRIEKAIEAARENGFLGENILGSSFSFDLEIRLGAGAFVCGEETALIASLEGKRGTPSPRPPYPSIKGLWGMPTVINNVETLSNVSYILAKGAKKFASIGTETSKGTKVFALTGKIKNSGLIEVPMGITLNQIVFEVGGGVIGGLEIKAVQTGGPSGGVIPKDLLDTPVDYENLQKLGSIMGSGGMIVMSEEDCMVDISKFYLKFCVDESCGKCAPCRIGGYQMLRILTNISEGKAEIEDLDKLKKIATAMQKASLCGLGQTAPNPVLSTLKYFEDEYKEHIIDKKCRVGKCQGLLGYYILSDKCVKCGACFRVCPAGAITGDRQSGYIIQQEKCIKCGQCYEVCKFSAIEKR